MQFNVVDRDTLLDAQKNPEKYKHLVVRVAGYCLPLCQDLFRMILSGEQNRDSDRGKVAGRNITGAGQ